MATIEVSIESDPQPEDKEMQHEVEMLDDESMLDDGAMSDEDELHKGTQCSEDQVREELQIPLEQRREFAIQDEEEQSRQIHARNYLHDWTSFREQKIREKSRRYET